MVIKCSHKMGDKDSHTIVAESILKMGSSKVLANWQSIVQTNRLSKVLTDWESKLQAKWLLKVVTELLQNGR